MTQWDWIARPEHYEARLVAKRTARYGIVFDAAMYQDGPPGWPCRGPEGGIASPGSTWYVCNGCGGEIARVANGGDGDWIDRQEREADVALEFHARNCQFGRDTPGVAGGTEPERRASVEAAIRKWDKGARYR